MNKNTTTDNVIIRPMKITEIPFVTEIHLKTFNGFFLTFLGYKFLKEYYYSIFSDGSSICFVATMKNQVIGFVVGSIQPLGLYKRLLRQRWWRFGIASVSAAFRKPTIIPRLLRMLNISENFASEMGVSTLIQISVFNEYQGKGLGRLLVSSFLNEAEKRGALKVNLTTDAKDNENVNKFYQNMGFKCTKTYMTPEGRVMNEYLMSLPEEISDNA